MLEIIAEIFDLGVKNPLKQSRFPDGYSEFFFKIINYIDTIRYAGPLVETLKPLETFYLVAIL